MSSCVWQTSFIKSPQMCSDNLTTINKDGKVNFEFEAKNGRPLQQRRMTEPGLLISDIKTRSFSNMSDFQDLLQATDSHMMNKNILLPQSMPEKKKKLPPGYINVHIGDKYASSDNIILDDSLVAKPKKTMTYVNVEELKDASTATKTQIESGNLPFGEALEKDIDEFNLGVEYCKPEIPFSNDDSYPIISEIAPPLKQKLSQKSTTASISAKCSKEFFKNRNYSGNAHSRPRSISVVDSDNNTYDQVLGNSSPYDKSKPRTLSSSFVINSSFQPTGDIKNSPIPQKAVSSPVLSYSAIGNETIDLNKNELMRTYGEGISTVTEQMQTGEEADGRKIRYFQHSKNVSDVPSPQMCDINSIEKEYSPNINQKPDRSPSNKPPSVTSSAFQSPSDKLPYSENKTSPCQIEKQIDSSNALPKRSSLRLQQNAFKHDSNSPSGTPPYLRQYVNSAGGGCVSPASDLAPRLLITSEQSHVSDSNANAALSTKFSSTNPFLHILQKNKELETSHCRSNNPFVVSTPPLIQPNPTPISLQQGKVSNTKQNFNVHNGPKEFAVFTSDQAIENPAQISTLPRPAATNPFLSGAHFTTETPNQFIKSSENTQACSNTTIQQHIHHHHHHHFHHAFNSENTVTSTQPTEPGNKKPIDVFDDIFDTDSATITFTPPPTIAFPSNNHRNDGTSARDVNPNSTHLTELTTTTPRQQIVLKPKEEVLSYKQLQNILHRNKLLLEKCGWYYGKMSADEGTQLLQNTVPGTFLIRDSSDPKYYFSLSMQRGVKVLGGTDDCNEADIGPTSIRIHFVNGKFQLDAEDRIRNIMPEFSNVVDLVQHYVIKSVCDLQPLPEKSALIDNNKVFQNAASQTLWVDSLGKFYQTIFLSYPLYKKDQTLTLSHICRLSINKSITSRVSKDSSGNGIQHVGYLGSIKSLNLPVRMKHYLEEYPNII